MTTRAVQLEIAPKIKRCLSFSEPYPKTKTLSYPTKDLGNSMSLPSSRLGTRLDEVDIYMELPNLPNLLHSYYTIIFH